MRATVAGAVLALTLGSAAGDVADDLRLLRDRCLYFAVGRAPLAPTVHTIRHGLWAQGPWSREPEGEIDLAASGFALAALPCAVTNGLVDLAGGYAIATNASRAVRELVAKSAGAATPEAIAAYGYRGMLFHYYDWFPVPGEFRASPGAEVSSVDTVLLMHGLLVAAQFFGGQVSADYEAARDQIAWRDWLDTATPGRRNQFRMGYTPGVGFEGWWDWYSQEAMLVCLFAAMSDPSIDSLAVWRGWRRERVAYTSPGPDPRRYECYATFFGDVFTVYYALAFWPLQHFPPPGDADGIDWFRQGRTAYEAHVEFFRKERGYLDGMTYSFFAPTGGGAIAHPKGSPDEPVVQTMAPVHAMAGGLPYYPAAAVSNAMAVTLSGLVRNTPGFFDWHGWPVATVVATNPAHPVHSNWVVGQDICFTAVAIENYLAGTVQRLALRDARLSRALSEIWRPAAERVEPAGTRLRIRWRAVPQSVYSPGYAVEANGVWVTAIVPWAADSTGVLQEEGLANEARSFHRLFEYTP